MLRKAARELVTELYESASAGSLIRQTGGVKQSNLWHCSPAPVCTCRSYATASHLATHTGRPQEKKTALRWLLLLPPAFAGLLGLWQVNRRQWKVELMERTTSGLQAEPRNVFDLGDSAEEYMRVQCQGRLMPQKSIYIGPRPRSAMGMTHLGYLLITPLVSDDWGRAVLVNRGWVPASWRTDAAAQARASPGDTEVSVSGVVRGSERRGGFVPDNVPERGEWFWVDVPEIAAACGLPRDTQLIEVVADSAGPPGQPSQAPSAMNVLAFQARLGPSTEAYPLPKQASDLLRFSVMPSDHRNYALTWFTLSAATAMLALQIIRR